MVRIISVSNLGYGDYGGSFSDKEVDGVEYSDPNEVKKEVQDPKEKSTKASKLKGGRKSG